MEIQLQLPLVFLKFHPLKYLKELQNGKLYCSTLNKMTELDPSDGRGDRYESVTRLEVGPHATINLLSNDTHTLMLRMPDGNYTSEHRNSDFIANLFCLYSMKRDAFANESIIQLPEKLLNLAPDVLMITNPKIFIERVVSALKNEAVPFTIDYIKYVDFFAEAQHKKTYFEKPTSYAYQHELRILFKNSVDAPKVLDIGSIKDVSTILPSYQLKKIKLNAIKKP